MEEVNSPVMSTPPGKKLKQARLPFAPVNKQKGTEESEEVGRKRKLSSESADAPSSNPPAKQEKVEYEEIGSDYVKKSDDSSNMKSKLAAFSADGEQKENSNVRVVKPKKKRAAAAEVNIDEEEELKERPDKVKGRVKLPFKKNKNKNKETSKEPEIIEVDLDSEEEKVVKPEKQEEKSEEKGEKGKRKKKESKKETNKVVEGEGNEDTSMTDDWAEFHEKELEKNPGERPTERIEKLLTPNPKDVSKKPASEASDSRNKNDEGSKAEQPDDCKKSDAPDPTTPKSNRKVLLAKDGKSPAINSNTSTAAKSPKSEKKPKVNPLANFLVKMKPGELLQKAKEKAERKLKEKKESASDDIQIVEETKKSEQGDQEEKRTEKSEKEEKDGQKLEETSVEKSSQGSGVICVDVEMEGTLSSTPSAAENSPKPAKSTPKSAKATSKSAKATPKTAKSTPKPGKSTPATSTPVTKTVSELKTGASESKTPETPAAIRAKQVALTRLRVRIQEINIQMEDAVKEENFLKAHELKQKISGLETEMETVQSAANFTAFTPTASHILTDASLNCTTDSLPSTPKPVAPSALKPKSLATPSTGTADTPSQSTPSTAGSKAKKVSTPGGAGDTGTPTSTLMPRQLTPKQLALQEARKRKAEADRLEKEKKKAELKAKKDQDKQDKDRQKEIEKRTKEIEKLEKDRAKREKDRKLEAEKKEKEAERLKKKEEKDEELKKKEEEKLKKEEERIKAEEAEKEKQRKIAAKFSQFFVKKDPAQEKKKVGEEPVTEDSNKFNPFQVKSNMRLAPLVRNDTEAARRRIDGLESPAGPSGLYLEILKRGEHEPSKQKRTWPYEKTDADNDNDDVEVIEEEDEEDMDEMDEGKIILLGRMGRVPRAKLLQFHTNQRPAYWGTWTKKSKFVTGRRPFGEEPALEYEYDSDDDWEDEGEGESLSDAEDENEKEEEDDYEVDNQFLVPHGYLSDEEEDKDEDEVFDPEKEKEKLKLKEREFQQECKKKTQQLKPRLWGCYWEDESLDTGAAAAQLVKILSGYAAIPVCNNNVPIPTSFSQQVPSPDQTIGDEGSDSVKKSAKSSRIAKCFPEEALSDLVRLVHINNNNKVFLAKEFIEFWNRKAAAEGKGFEEGSANAGTPTTGQTQASTISKRKVVDKIKEIADYKLKDGKTGRFWLVKPEVLEKLGIEVGETNNWTYILEQPNNAAKSTAAAAPEIEKEGGGGSKPSSPVKPGVSPNPASLITKFTKVLTEEERAKNLKRAPAPAAKRLKLSTPAVSGKASPIQVKKTPGPPGQKTAAVPVNPIQVKKAPGSISVRNFAKIGAVAANPIPVKRAPGPTPSQIQVKRAPGPVPVNSIPIRKAPKTSATQKTASGAINQLRNFAGITVTKSNNKDDDCITID